MNEKKDDPWGWGKPKNNKQKNDSEVEQKDVVIPRVNYFIQSTVYLLGASLYQTQNTIRQGIDITWIEHFVIAFLIFGLISWLLLTGVLYLIERKKENKSNTTLWLGIGFIAIYLFI